MLVSIFLSLFWFSVVGCTDTPSSGGPEKDSEVNATIEPSRAPIPQPANKDVTERNTSEERPSSVRFEEKTASSGVRFKPVNGEEADYFTLLESLGSGGALLDYDLDGSLDLMFAGGGGFESDKSIFGEESGLFRSIGDWKFIATDSIAGVSASRFYSHGINAGDFNNDGFVDVLVTGFGGLQLFRNCGDGTFTEVAMGCRLEDSSWSSSSAWGDIDRDGDLELYVAHYLNWNFDNDPECRAPQGREICPPRRFDGLPDILYDNNGDETFRDQTQELGLEPDGKGLGVMIADFDLDGWSDIYVCNDTVPNFLYHNDGSGRLANEGISSGTALSENGVSQGSMGVDLGDFDRDGLPDIWVANYENESFALYRKTPRFYFRHVSRQTGVTAMGGLYVGWGTSFIDFDRDGDEDIVGTCGHVIRFPPDISVKQRPIVLENLDGKRYVNVADAAGPYMQGSYMGRGLAVGDIDSDGDADLLVTHTNEPIALLSNESPNTNQWLSVRLIGTISNRDAIGARIILRSDDGVEQHRQIVGGTSYASSSAPEMMFGLGAATSIREVEIQWPSGTTTHVASPTPNQLLSLIEPTTPLPKE